MKIRKEMIAGYLRFLTQGRAVNMPDPMSDLSNFDADIRSMRASAERDGNMNWLRLALDALIADPGGRIDQFAGQQYPFDDMELVEIFSRAYKILWPDEELSEPGEELELEFADMSVEEWDAIVN